MGAAIVHSYYWQRFQFRG